MNVDSHRTMCKSVCPRVQDCACSSGRICSLESDIPTKMILENLNEVISSSKRSECEIRPHLVHLESIEELTHVFLFHISTS
jgi:hypothetical protein